MEFWTGEEWERRDYWISEPGTTNNRMAIRSAIEGLRGLTTACRVRFVSDSQYLVKGIREWVPSWKRRGWRRKAGPPENVDLWKRLDEMAKRHEVTWEWVRGHAGDPRNEYADRLAVGAAERQDASGGFVPSRFVDWLNEQREERERYLDFYEFVPPGSPEE